MRFPKLLSRRLVFVVICIFIVCFIFTPQQDIFGAPKVRIKDIAFIQGVRENQLLGIGLVTGLAGRGDSSGSSLLKKVLSSFVSNFGIEIASDNIKSRNCAVVMVSAEVPAFIRAGDRIDINVSSIGDARSLEGGILLQTNLKAANGQVYAVGQGKVMVPVSRGSVKTVGCITSGAIIEKEILSEFVKDGSMSIILRHPDFVTAGTLAKAVKEAFEQIHVSAIDASMIKLDIPEAWAGDPVAFIGKLESLLITPDITGKVVIDSQTGIIIIGESVKIGKVAVSYKTINVSVGSFNEDENPSSFVIEETTSVDDFVKTLKTVGLKTDVIIGMLKAIEKAGALYGMLIII